jgi:hypothetical protein
MSGRHWPKPQVSRMKIRASSQSIPSVPVPLVRQPCTPDARVYVNASKLNTAAIRQVFGEPINKPLASGRQAVGA